jgi:hypothetical protein
VRDAFSATRWRKIPLSLTTVRADLTLGRGSAKARRGFDVLLLFYHHGRASERPGGAGGKTILHPRTSLW